MEGGGARFDIQVLRGIAVLLVIAYHAFPALAPHGYLGVDAFFVISGFLVGGMVLRELEAGHFTFTRFYARRFWRLVPACLCMLTGTMILAWWLLLPEDWPAFLQQAIGALTFTANIILPQQLSYFAPEASTKPLLHVWSLSLEEQFYLFIPVLLWLTKPTLRRAVLIGLGIGSLAVCVMAASAGGEPSKFAFFSLFARAWELVAGTLVAKAAMERSAPLVGRTAQRCALAVLLAVCFIGIDEIHPRADAVIIVVCTAIILGGSSNWLPQCLPTSALARAGDWSYSLYLVHWPLLCFLGIVTLGQATWWMKLFAVVLTFLLGWAQYRHIEQRFRSWGKQGTAWRRAVIAGAGPLALAITLVPGAAQASAAREPEPGLRPECAQRTGRLLSLTQCQTSTAPTVAIWGDSFAMHLVPGLERTPDLRDSLLQLTKHACPPILNFAPAEGSLGPLWAKNCISYNSEAFAKIARVQSVRVVILSSPWWVLESDSNGRGAKALAETTRTLRRHGKRVILIGPPPSTSIDLRQCVERFRLGYLILGRSDCAMPPNDEKRGAIERALLAVPADRHLLSSSSFCNARRCAADLGGRALYRDGSHLSFFGSEHLARDQLSPAIRHCLRLNLGRHRSAARIDELARAGMPTARSRAEHYRGCLSTD